MPDTIVETGLHSQRALPDLSHTDHSDRCDDVMGFEGSDGLQNLTEPWWQRSLLRAGVYVVIHDPAYPVHRVRKDHKLGRFVWTEDAGD